MVDSLLDMWLTVRWTPPHQIRLGAKFITRRMQSSATGAVLRAFVAEALQPQFAEFTLAVRRDGVDTPVDEGKTLAAQGRCVCCATRCGSRSYIV